MPPEASFCAAGGTKKMCHPEASFCAAGGTKKMCRPDGTNLCRNLRLKICAAGGTFLCRFEALTFLGERNLSKTPPKNKWQNWNCQNYMYWKSRKYECSRDFMARERLAAWIIMCNAFMYLKQHIFSTHTTLWMLNLRHPNLPGMLKMKTDSYLWLKFN